MQFTFIPMDFSMRFLLNPLMVGFGVYNLLINILTSYLSLPNAAITYVSSFMVISQTRERRMLDCIPQTCPCCFPTQNAPCPFIRLLVDRQGPGQKTTVPLNSFCHIRNVDSPVSPVEQKWSKMRSWENSFPWLGLCDSSKGAPRFSAIWFEHTEFTPRFEWHCPPLLSFMSRCTMFICALGHDLAECL